MYKPIKEWMIRNQSTSVFLEYLNFYNPLLLSPTFYSMRVSNSNIE